MDLLFSLGPPASCSLFFLECTEGFLRTGSLPVKANYHILQVVGTRNQGCVVPYTVRAMVAPFSTVKVLHSTKDEVL